MFAFPEAVNEQTPQPNEHRFTLSFRLAVVGFIAGAAVFFIQFSTRTTKASIESTARPGHCKRRLLNTRRSSALFLRATAVPFAGRWQAAIRRAFDSLNCAQSHLTATFSTRGARHTKFTSPASGLWFAPLARTSNSTRPPNEEEQTTTSAANDPCTATASARRRARGHRAGAAPDGRSRRGAWI